MATERGGIARDDQRIRYYRRHTKKQTRSQNMGKKQQPKELINVYYGVQLGVGFDILSVNFIYIYCFCFVISSKMVRISRMRISQCWDFPSAADAWGYFTTLKPYQFFPIVNLF
jgi:hypothetical protein